MFINTVQHINTYGPTYEATRRIRTLQQQLQDEFNMLNTQKWNNIIDTLNNYGPKDSREFWRMIEGQIGKTKHENLPYLVDSNGNKLYTDEEKEQAMRRQWQNVFRISDEENKTLIKILN